MNELIHVIKMFFVLSTELTILFLIISYAVGLLQEKVPPEKIRSILMGNKGSRGYILSAILGAITPFCSCSTIPFLKGLLKANVGFGPIIVFLFSSPLLNPIIVIMFFATFGWKVALTYFIVAMSVSIFAGITFEKLGFAKLIKWKTITIHTPSCSSPCEKSIKKQNIWKKVWKETWKDFKGVFPYLLLGISIGSVIYGFMPTELLQKMAGGNSNIIAIPIAAIIGIPLYIRAEAVIALGAILVTKGVGIGIIMALVIGSAGASLTEVILLKSLFKNKLIIAFLVVVLGMAIATGYISDLVY